MIHAYDFWENTQQRDLFRSLFSQPDLRRYPFVEIPRNSQIFHVDLKHGESGSRWRRFIFDDIEKVFDFFSTTNSSDFQISLQSRLDSTEPYFIKKITRIYLGTRTDGRVTYIFAFSDASSERSDALDLDENPISNQQCVWTSSI